MYEDAVNKLAQVLWWHGDNQAVLAISHHGISAALRHMGRTMGVSLSFIRDCIENGYVKHPYISTELMCADMFTKFFAAKKKTEWASVKEEHQYLQSYREAIVHCR